MLALLCRPAEIVASVPLPRALAAWAIDSGLPHAVSGDVYRRVRCATFMGYALLECAAGHLAELERDDVNVRLLPQRMLGADFLQLREGITDPVSALVPAVEYGVRAATLFPLEEHARAREFLTLLGEKPDDDVFRRIGDLMYESHAGYSLCGLGVSRTDEIVEAVREAGVPEGLIGARVSGGGEGAAAPSSSSGARRRSRANSSNPSQHECRRNPELRITRLRDGNATSIVPRFRDSSLSVVGAARATPSSGRSPSVTRLVDCWAGESCWRLCRPSPRPN